MSSGAGRQRAATACGIRRQCEESLANSVTLDTSSVAVPIPQVSGHSTGRWSSSSLPREHRSASPAMSFPATLAAALAPYQRQNAIAFSFNPDYPMCPTAIPLPPLELMKRVGSPDAANYLFVCDQWAQVVGRLLQPRTRILDIGAGCGKPARAFLYHPHVIEYVGLDVDVDLVNWSNAYLRPSSSQRFLFTFMDVKSDA